MNISKSTWHYRVLNKLEMLSYHETLCKYFWKMVIALVGLPFIAILVTTIMLVPLYWTFVVNYIPAALPIAILVGGFEIIILGKWLQEIVVDRHTEEIRAGTREKSVLREPKPPSIFRLWLRAKHEQVCPLIIFVEDDEGKPI